MYTFYFECLLQDLFNLAPPVRVVSALSVEVS